MRCVLSLLASIILLTSPSFAEQIDCPSTMYYANGQLLKNGSALWYENGQLLKNAGAVWYPNGQLLKNAGAVWYSNGQLMKNAGARWYANGQLLANGSALWYRSGQLLKNGNTFWYPNGQLAKNGSTLWRPNGTITNFPVTLEESGPEGAYIYAYLTQNESQVQIYQDDFDFRSSLVSGWASWEGDDLAIELFVNTGIRGEDIWLTMDSSGTRCSLFID